MAEPSPAGSGRIFISYRREETAYPAGWLYDRLVDRFGGDQVFKDVDSIQPGDDYAEVIASAVGSCDVLVALIGDSWASTTDEHGNRRLDDPDDLVRLEIEAALTRQVRVIPILVDGAKMPRADELPESLMRLVRRQGLDLSPSRFDTDLDRLVRVVDGTLAEVRSGEESAVPAGQPDHAVAGAALAAAPAPPPAAGTESHDAVAGTAQPHDGGRVAEPGPTDGGVGPPAAGGPPQDEPRRRRSGLAWVLAALGAAVVLVLAGALIAALVADSDSTSSSDEDTTDGQAPSAASGGVEVDTRPDTSPEGITLSDLDFGARNDPPLVGDTATVTYTLTNDSDQDVTLAFTFVGVRNPAGDNVDAEDENEGVVLPTGQSIPATGSVLIDEAGQWEFWPCYELDDGSVCPDKWRVIPVLVPEG